MVIAKIDDLNLTEFAAFNYGHEYPMMRRWEFPFVLFHLELSSLTLDQIPEIEI